MSAGILVRRFQGSRGIAEHQERIPRRSLPFAPMMSLAAALIVGCSGGGGDASSPSPTALDRSVQALTTAQHLTGDASTGRNLPSIDDALPQLGRMLFFSKSLGGGMDSSCASCHHPMLGGADGLSLSVGVDAVNPDVMGLGRARNDGPPQVPRNAPTTFNAGLWDQGLFDDTRVESLGKLPGMNGAGSGIRTPDSSLGNVDSEAGGNLPTAQARFPITSVPEMLGTFEPGQSHDVIRNRLAARIGNYGDGAGELAVNNWLPEFQKAFGSTADAQTLITYANIATAIGEYERSQTFVHNPWRAYLRGDLHAISESAKHGAQLFFTDIASGGGGCSSCHSGDLFSDEQSHGRAFPQIGIGKGDGPTGDDDLGRMRETQDTADIWHFRTPTLLNIAVTAPYGHDGAYATLEQVVRHELDPVSAVSAYFAGNAWCGLPQFSGIANCSSLYPDAPANTQVAVDQLVSEQNTGLAPPATHLSDADIADIVAFLQTLTDPCVLNRACLARWIPDVNSGGPDGNQLNAKDAAGNYY